MGLLCLIIIVVVLVTILDHDKCEEAECIEYEDWEQEERDSPLVGERTRIFIRLPHDKE